MNNNKPESAHVFTDAEAKAMLNWGTDPVETDATLNDDTPKANLASDGVVPVADEIETVDTADEVESDEEGTTEVA